MTTLTNGYTVLIDRSFNRIIVVSPCKAKKETFHFEEEITPKDELEITKNILTLKTINE